RSLGVAGEKIPPGLEERSGLWRSMLAERRVLVVLDNAADAAQARPLIPGRPGSLALITSRRRMPTIDGAALISLDAPPPPEATALLAQIIGVGRVNAEPAAAGEVVELCGRLPLAIRIAAARLRHSSQWSVERLAGRLRAERSRLAELAVDDRDIAVS